MNTPEATPSIQRLPKSMGFFFSDYVSNSAAGCANQSIFKDEHHGIGRFCRTYIRATQDSSYPTSFLFSNIVDSTFADGSTSKCNRVLACWTLRNATVGVVSYCSMTEPTQPDTFYNLTFGGYDTKFVSPGELFSTDPIPITIKAGQYYCLTFCFNGPEVPCHPESLVPSFVHKFLCWRPSTDHPFPIMVGVDNAYWQRVAFLGDSITQGIGTTPNSYEHWTALVANRFGTQYPCWNLGIGYARAADAATTGSWLFKARQNDIVVVCLGVNDLLHTPNLSAETLVGYLQTIVQYLQEYRTKVVLQTIPPFDYSPETTLVWKEANRLIQERFASICPIFDTVPLLSLSPEEPQRARFGGHPNAEGCRIWADALCKFLFDTDIVHEPFTRI